MMKYLFGGAGLITLSLALTLVNRESVSTPLASTAAVVKLTPDSIYNRHVTELYQSAHLAESGLIESVFEKAVTGFYNLKKSGQLAAHKDILTIADFDQNSTKKRLWIIDLDKKKLLLNTWVAHGQRSGNDKATRFSNTNDSFQSSIGFYLTAEVYRGQHGKSLRLDGMDEGFNSNARKRSIVVHGADYVSQGTINALGRLGRSQGCPAVPPGLANQVIDSIEGGTVLFINVSDPYYTSRYLNTHVAAMFATNDIGGSSQTEVPTNPLRI
ncbi:murein L,D-transpeptidase catalytic domain family protein [Pedobacter sp. N36a]|uniref:murein L,D-transpeptidase catalytic domain family protein n=1 Tax=Pedobacter sp. N36a TaxID=2767996 RepID=UPI001656D32C|nr:murein L,D-transpeptidase catalytic domain family protein [Pedobacter sp. N36a]MBC8985165.1 murein L,D-transpeptidase catalytic domain family protein [Pedobacter sp. N36a]